MFETLSKGFRSARNLLSGVTELTSENLAGPMREVRRALLEADVDLELARGFVESVKASLLGAEVGQKLRLRGEQHRVGPAERFIYACQQELTAMMADEGEPLVFKPKPAISGIMLVGLQGAGKTTTAGKLANYLKHTLKRSPMLVAADVQRPGAIEQLAQLASRIDVPFFSIPGGIPEEICERGRKEAVRQRCDTVIYDTAGRLAIADDLMAELERIQLRVSPENVFFVVDAMIGQDAVRTARTFHERLGLDGVVLTKLDGDARGGAALSVKRVTGAPVKFVGMGEDLARLEPFRADGMASRILGFGDIVGLMQDLEGVVDEAKAEADASRMLQGNFTFDDFLEQMSVIQRMGPMQEVLERLPFFADSVPDGFRVDEKDLGRTTAIVRSMTAAERRNSALFQRQPTRLNRVAKGSGQAPAKVAALIQNFEQMRTLFSSIGSQAGVLSKVPGMKQLAAANKMRSMVKAGGGLESNPMLANLAESLLEAAVASGQAPGVHRPPSPAKQMVSGASLAAVRSKKKAARKDQRKARKRTKH